MDNNLYTQFYLMEKGMKASIHIYGYCTCTYSHIHGCCNIGMHIFLLLSFFRFKYSVFHCSDHV